MRVHHETKSDGVKVHHEKDRWVESFTIRKSDGVKFHHEKKGDGVRDHHEKERWVENSP